MRISLISSLALLGLAAALPACTTGSLEPGFESQLTEQGGCADVILYAHSEDDTLAMFLRIDAGLTQQAHEAGGAVTVTLPATDPSVELTVETGKHLTTLVCNDVVTEQPVVDATYRATAGSLNITVTPQGDANDPMYPAFATVVLTGVQFAPEEGTDDAVPMPAYTFDNIYVGWLAG